VLLLTLLGGQCRRVRLEYEWLQRGLLFHLRLLIVLVATPMATAGKLTVFWLSFRVTVTRALDVLLLGTAFAAAEQEQYEKDQKQHATSNCTTDDVLLVVR